MMPLLEVENVHAFYQKNHVLQGVSLAISKGEIVSLLGRNGAGRSTLAKAIVGQVRTVGSIKFKGKELIGLPAFQIAHRGIGYVPENRDIFCGLSVHENLALGLKKGSRSRWKMDDIYTIFPVLYDRRNTSATVLSGGEQQMLALCRTLLGDPELIVVDEPTEGLAPIMVKLVSELLIKLKTEGISILLIEQKLTMALAISQRLYVMGKGSIVFGGTTSELQQSSAIRSAWLEV